MSIARDARGLEWGLGHVPGAVCFVVDKTRERFSVGLRRSFSRSCEAGRV